MRLTIIGTGYVGQVSGVCFANAGNDVMCLDIDAEKVKRLSKGTPTIHEQGLPEMLERNLKEKRISFTTDKKKAIEFGDMIFLCVDTPEGPDGNANLDRVFTAAGDVAKYMNGYKIIVTKSTVPLGTTEAVKEYIAQRTKYKFDVASNPEFLQEGKAVRDFTAPDRVIVGVESDKVKKAMETLYKFCVRADRPLVCVDIATSELIKYASNSMLATRISFMNMLVPLCEKTGADVKKVAQGMGFDNRIGSRFLQAGVGFGGSCFPKDVKALQKTLENHQCDSSLMHAVLEINVRQHLHLLPPLLKHLKSVKKPVVAIWGLSFKPETDDMRHAPSIPFIQELQKKKIEVHAFDPVAMENAKRHLPTIKYVQAPYDALKGADALVLLTEWDEFRLPDLSKMKKLMRHPIIFDGRNVLDPAEVRAAGFKYVSIGRP